DSIDRLGVKFGSNSALQLLGEQLWIYADTASAEAALASAIQASSCPSEDNYANPSPHRVVVDGADDAHAFGFADENGSIGIVLARSDRTVLVMSTRLHNGAASVEPIGTARAAELAIARLRAGSP